jgi:hypothetical protein
MQFSSPPPASAARSGFGRVIFPGTGQPPPNGLISGRVLFPGTGGPPGTPLSITDPTFASRLGTTVGGLNNGHFRRFHRPAGAAPYAYPIYGGGYYVGGYSDYGYGYDAYGYPPDQSNTPMAYPTQQAPQVIINQNFIPEHANPVVREYSEDSSGGIHLYEAPTREPEEGAADESTSYYLIAFKDHSIYSAYAYWVEGDTLHYVTPQRVHNQASLSLVDRELTEKLNRNHAMQVKLPK